MGADSQTSLSPATSPRSSRSILRSSNDPSAIVLSLPQGTPWCALNTMFKAQAQLTRISLCQFHLHHYMPR